MEKATREATFWSCEEGQERLIHTTIKDAIEDYVDQMYPDTAPESLKVYGYAPMEVTDVEWHSRWVLDKLLIRLDEEYGDPDGDYSGETEAMKAASLEFVGKVLQDYAVFACEEVERRVVMHSDHV